MAAIICGRQVEVSLYNYTNKKKLLEVTRAFAAVLFHVAYSRTTIFHDKYPHHYSVTASLRVISRCSCGVDSTMT
jgi:hypothetical protein